MWKIQIFIMKLEHGQVTAQMMNRIITFVGFAWETNNHGKLLLILWSLGKRRKLKTLLADFT